MQVSLLNLKLQYQGIREEVRKEIEKVCDNQSFILGENVKALEQEIAGYCNAKFAIGVGSGTDAILLALMAAGVGARDMVITTPYTFFATASSIARLNANPIFIDIEPDTYNIDPNKLEACLKQFTGRSSRFTVKAIIPVHLFGQCAEMEPILKISKKHKLTVIEDAAQAIGAEYKGERAGSIGDFGCFSFYPSKNLGGFGDGGMVVTNNERMAEKVKILRVHGSKPKYYHKFVGINSRLDELQAAVLRVKLRHLATWTNNRIERAKKYDKLFQDVGLTDAVSLPTARPYNRHVFNQYIIRVKKRDSLREYLAKEGIGTEVYYPVPLHLQECFKYLGYKKGDFPVSEKAAKETLALPIYPELTPEEQEYVVDKIAGFYGKANL
ncbi:MAG: DegT/DnrJ/EryC1/StrS family aminotransferase [Deltaproteobacteria bacterium]|nr:DegT/DnrJ/EryC1/StrS family aminotransferase [Deltaproteobacteria bacterium]